MLLFRSDHVSAFFLPGNTPFVLVAFSPMNTPLEGENFWGKRFAEKSGISTIGIVSHEPDWYPLARLEPAFEAIDAVLADHATVVTYGGSMGAYAALKHSRRLNAKTTIALAPQHSINPSDETATSRFFRYYSTALNGDMKIVTNDIAGDAFAFYDPYFPDDRASVGAIERATARVIGVRVPRGGHELTRVFASTPAGIGLIAACQTRDIVNIRKFVTSTRRASPTRARIVSETLAGSRLPLALKIFRSRCRSCTLGEKRDALTRFSTAAKGSALAAEIDQMILDLEAAC